jgi:CRP-like cAMP-binding protein
MGSSASAAAVVQLRPLTRKLARFVTLSPDETAILNELQSSTRTVQRHSYLTVEGRNYDSLSVIIDGIAIRYRILNDGRRQVMNFLLPGDIVDILGIFSENSLYSTKSLTKIAITDIPIFEIKQLFATQSQLVIKIFWNAICENAVDAEHIVDLGKRSAAERIAHFFLELLVRLQAVGLADECSYRIPLTRELIGDAVGLTCDHLSRVLRRLREDNLVVFEEQRVTIKDIERLSELADFEPGYLHGFSAQKLLDG